jgi:hypothetical protein
MHRQHGVLLLAVLALIMTGNRSATAMPALFTGSSADLSASAAFEFDASDGSLRITLTNTSTADVMVPSDVLTGLFFDVSPGTLLSLHPGSAVLGARSSVLFGKPPAGGVVGGEWAFAGCISSSLGANSYGLSSSGLGIFGPADRFPGPNLAGPDAPGGLEYGITSAGDDPTTGNKTVTGSNALIRNQVVLTLMGLPGGFDPATQIMDVSWQYGTSPSEPSFSGQSITPGVPEPVAGIMLIAGLAAALTRKRAQGPAMAWAVIRR